MTLTLLVAILLNQYRFEADVQPSKVLTKLAQERCGQIVEFSHKGWKGFDQTVLNTGAWAAGENLYFNPAGTPVDALQASTAVAMFEKSPEHYKNNHGPYTHVGVGTCVNKVTYCINTHAYCTHATSSVMVVLYGAYPQR